MIKLFSKNKRFFSRKEENKIILAIRRAERQTSGEIRVHIQHFLEKDVLEEATQAFFRLKMDHTKERNGIIFFLSPERKKFAVYGDEGIHEKVPPDFWMDVKSSMEANFRKNHFVEGLVKGIELTGKKLHEYFPSQSNEQNELPDEISYE